MKIHLQYIAKTLQDKLLIYRIDEMPAATDNVQI